MANEKLGNFQLLKKFSNEDLTTLGQIAKTSKWAAGQHIFNQGEPAKAIYFLKYGSVRITKTGPKGEEIEVGLLGSGSHFGEMAFLDGKNRTGTATAAENCEVLQLEFDTLNKLFEKQPRLAANFYKTLALFLAGRLENTTKDLSFSREKNLKVA